ncbi:MerR family DNA-binding transcriptional regulator [Prauserella muralis]|uniref:MerR family DNA-binding transcriptional regulator n=1 Tax=Prauserella muralis TaxID=588067 RepID=UPI000DD3112A|nr:MerR family DNA-binding transcriptional regulator [Prauserella muralis]
MIKKRLVSTGELARELSVSRRTIQRYVEDGLLEPTDVTLGGHYRWDVDLVRRRIRELLKERNR